MKKGLVFRSDHLSRLTPGDQATLQRLHFKVVCDFRSAREQQLAPDLLPLDGSIRLLPLPIQTAGFDHASAMDRLRAKDSAWLALDFFVELYRCYLDDFGPVWGEVLQVVASPANLPLVFHCTGGKDRTGICAALLLMALGVPEETIFADHDRSNACNAKRLQPIYREFATLGIGREKAALYLQAVNEPLAAMLAHLRAAYGSVENYLRTKAGLDATVLAALRSGLLQ